MTGEEPARTEAGVDAAKLQLQLVARGGVAPGPDGQPWCLLIISWGLVTVQLLVPEIVAEDAVEKRVLDGQLEQAVRLAKMARGAALQVATAEDLAKLGQHAARPPQIHLG